MNKPDIGLFRSAKDARQFYASPLVAWGLPIITGLIAGILVALIVTLVAWRFLNDDRPFFTFTITMFVVALLVWFQVISWIFRKIELIPGRPAGVFEISVKSNQGKRLNLYRFKSVTPDEFRKVAMTFAQGGDLTYDSLNPILGRTRAGAFRSELLQEKLAEWKDPNEHRSGIVLTRAGQVIFRNYHLLPTLEVDNA